MAASTKSKLSKGKTPYKRKSPTNDSNSKTNDDVSFSASSFSSKSLTNNTFLSQLESLRSFLSDSGVTFAENDLVTCLSRCGYNVQLAAEQLLTGQFKPSNNASSSNCNKCTIDLVTHNDDSMTHSTHQTIGQEENTLNNRQLHSNNENTTAATDTNRKSAFSKIMSTARKSSNSSSSASNSTNINGSVIKPKLSILTNSTSVSSSPLAAVNAISSHSDNIQLNKRKSPIVEIDDTEEKYNNFDNEQYKKRMKKIQQEHEHKLLLCQRWIVAFSTTRKGIINHHEEVEISHTSNSSSSSNKQYNVIRFKGRHIEGTFDKNMSNFLSPLLAYTDMNQPKPLIAIEARGLMYDDSIRIGTEVPLEVSVYIIQPILFFNLFHSDDKVATTPTVSSSSNHPTNHTKTWYNNKKGPEILPKGGRNNVSIIRKNAAFDLLQWAQYGDVPVFKSTLNNETEKLQLDIQGNDEANIDDIVNESLVGQHNEENVPTWANDIFDNGKSTLGTSQEQDRTVMEEEDDPCDLNNKNVFLRPYQRQALYWMLNRENNANSKMSKDFQEQLELLSDLASEATNCADKRGRGSISHNKSDYIDNEIGIKCETGPVLVSEDVSSKSLTLEGIEDPICHPLWKKRYLWDKKECGTTENRRIYSFFVNELLQTASKITPNPPRECSGGILADSMGLGKTVMLLALICKDKETSTSATSKSFETSHSEEEEKKNDPVDMLAKDISANHCTLIVTPLSLLPQWEEEIKSKTSLSWKTIYGDTSRNLSRQSELRGIDVLITTYGTLQSEFSNRDKNKSTNSSILFLKFRRVILDEGHLIKNPVTAVSKACCAINADRRWCVTGTPIVNSLHDVFGLLKFLKHEPWSSSSFWKNAISNIMNDDDSEDGMKVALGRVKRVISPLLLRRTKDTLDKNGNQILELPPIEKKIVNVEFTDGERLCYNFYLNKSQSIFDGLISAGAASTQYFQIFSLLTRLRQSCDHLSLTVKSQFDDDEDFSESHKVDSKVNHHNKGAISDQPNNDFVKELLQTFKEHQANRKQEMSEEQQIAAKHHSDKVALTLKQCVESNSNVLEDECSICLERLQANDIAITPCSHIFCRKCILDALKTKNYVKMANDDEESRKCPICMANIKPSLIRFTGTISREQNTDPNLCSHKKNEENARETLLAQINGRRSSKITAILNELDNIWEIDPGSKIIIFSQYLGMLDLIGAGLKSEGIASFKLNGKMSLKERRSTLQEFGADLKSASQLKTSDKSTQGSVLLASMKACGVGLNLVCASTVFIVDPWWNAAQEDQCVNRIHRIGQQAKVVRVRKFIVLDSVEEKIVKMQERKNGVASEVLSNQDSVDSNKSKPTLDDIKAIFGR